MPELDDITSLIGEGVHTGLRKLSDHPASARAWNAISELPDEDWTYICRVVAETVQQEYAREAADA